MKILEGSIWTGRQSKQNTKAAGIPWLYKRTVCRAAGGHTEICSDIELGVKGMSVPTLCKISSTLRLTTDYILFGRAEVQADDPISLLLHSCTNTEREYAESLLKRFFWP